MENNRIEYIGNIIGFEGSNGSIYNINPDDTKCYAWKANVKAEVDIENIRITFNWNGEAFELKADLVKENYFTGKIFCNEQLSGSIFIWKYSNSDGFLLKGDYVEDGRNFDCFIDLYLKKHNV